MLTTSGEGKKRDKGLRREWRTHVELKLNNILKKFGGRKKRGEKNTALKENTEAKEESIRRIKGFTKTSPKSMCHHNEEERSRNITRKVGRTDLRNVRKTIELQIPPLSAVQTFFSVIRGGENDLTYRVRVPIKK